MPSLVVEHLYGIADVNVLSLDSNDWPGSVGFQGRTDVHQSSSVGRCPTVPIRPSECEEDFGSFA